MCRKLIYLVPFVLLLSLVGTANGVEGLLGQYYRGSAGDPWQQLLLERIDATVDFNWGVTAPDPAVGADNFTVRWTGMITAPSSATYTFYTQTDDGVRLWVNGQQLINNWTDHSSTLDSGDIDLAAGQQYEIILEYYEAGGDAVCELSWSTPSMPQAIVPSQYLSNERPFPRNPEPADGAVLRDTFVSISWNPGDYAASADVYLGDNFDDVAAGTGDTFRGNQVETSFAAGFPGFPYPDGLVKGTTYYWRIVDVEDDGVTKYEGPVWSFSIAPKSTFDPEPVDGSESVDPNVVLSWKPGFGAILNYVYFGDDYDVVSNAEGGMPWGASAYSPGTLDFEKVYYWRVDAFHGVETVKGDVWSFSTPGAVGSPFPSNNAVDVTQVLNLTWVASDSAASHQVYFGADKNSVVNADTASSQYKGSKDLGSESYDPGKLEWDTLYYWRIDEVATDGATQKGMIWSFTTANFIVVDDIESYNNIEEGQPGSNRIYNTWLDGFGDPTNGSQVGHLDPPFYEETNVHSGNKSMPFYYDNTAGRSEATMTLTYPRDWTEGGVDKLTIWFHGSVANEAEQMYVTLNNSATVNHDDPQAALIPEWTQWNIDLTLFSDLGVNLTDVNTITLGLRSVTGGSGMLFFDDIRLYPPAP